MSKVETRNATSKETFAANLSSNPTQAGCLTSDNYPFLLKIDCIKLNNPFVHSKILVQTNEKDYITNFLFCRTKLQVLSDKTSLFVGYNYLKRPKSKPVMIVEYYLSFDFGLLFNIANCFTWSIRLK